MIWLVSHDGHGLTSQMTETDDNVLGILALDLEKISVVQHFSDDIPDVVGLVGIIGNH